MHAARTVKNRRLPTVLVALLLAMVLLPLQGLSVPHLAHAENDGARPNFFERLFGVPKRVEQRQPRPKVTVRPNQKKPKRAKVAVQAGNRTAPSIEVEQKAVEKLVDARKVLVVGDFMAGGVAEGLETAFADLPGVLVVNKSSGSSGFVRDDHFDWPGQIAAIIAEVQPAAVVMMIGSNDRQQMRADGQSLRPRSDEWNVQYAKRLANFSAQVKEAKVPLVWVGAPSFRISTMSADMLAFNDMYKQAAMDAGGEFVDVWDGFVDDTGAFATTGPDINGQPVRLRASDGINITKAGKRKLAFYAEKPLRKLLGTAVSPDGALIGDQGKPGAEDGPDAGLPKIDVSLPMALTDPDIDGGDELLGQVALPVPSPGTDPASAGVQSIQGVAPIATPGRADDFARSSVRPTPQAAVPPSAKDTTGAINR